MDNNIFTFVNYKYNSFSIANLIARIISIFTFSYILIMYVQLTAPNGFNNISLINSENILITCLLTITAFAVSLFIICLYTKKKKWSFIAMRFITNAYLTVGLLLCSMLRYNGTTYYIEENFYLLVKISLYVVCGTIYSFVLTKRTIKNFASNNGKNDHIWLALIPCSVLLFSQYLKQLELSANVVLPTFAYLMSIGLLIHTIALLARTYYAKKYKIC